MNDYDPYDDTQDPDRKNGPEKRSSKGFFTVMIILIVVAFFLVFGKSVMTPRPAEMTISEFEDVYAKDNVQELTLVGDEIVRGKFRVETRGKRDFEVKVNKSYIEKNIERWSRDALGVGEIKMRSPFELKVDQPNLLFQTFLIQFVPWLIIILLFWFFFLRQMRGAGGPGGILAFGRSRAFASKDKTGVTFDDVAGIDEAKEEVREIVEFLKNSDRFKKLGARIPHGVLLIGSPGTGKTLLAKAIAGEAQVPFFSISGSDFVEMFVGVGASRVRDLFKRAKAAAPCIIFLDEIDAVGRRRGSGWGGGHDEREQTLNAILVEMDGFAPNQGVIVIAATNRPDVLDPALRRPGRFDREITVDLPDLAGREKILQVHSRKIVLDPGAELKRIAQGTPTFSGAELENLINEAALLAALKDHPAVTLDDLWEARDKVRWGRQKKSRVIAEEEQKVTAYHEAGHAVITTQLPGADPLHKVSIIPRGMALGSTMSLPEKDKYGHRKQQLLNEIKILYGGRVAEEMFCGDITTGAQNDIERATRIATLMVTDWGMSDKLGPINYTREDSWSAAWTGQPDEQRQFGAETAAMIDKEIQDLLLSSLDATRKMLEARRADVEKVAQALLKYETLTAEDVDALLRGASVDTLKPEPAVRVLKTPQQAADLSEKEKQKSPGILAPKLPDLNLRPGGAV